MAENISRTILAAGADTGTIARAANIDSAKIVKPLTTEDELTLGELVRVGGALFVSPGSLLAGVA